jgi:hypothetical protein
MDKRLPPIELVPDIETPVIDIQDLEHSPGPATRVNDAGIEVLPQLDLAKDDNRVLEAIEELEKSIKDLSPD